MTKIVGYEYEWIISRLPDYWVTNSSDPLAPSAGPSKIDKKAVQRSTGKQMDTHTDTHKKGRNTHTQTVTHTQAYTQTLTHSKKDTQRQVERQTHKHTHTLSHTDVVSHVCFNPNSHATLTTRNTTNLTFLRCKALPYRPDYYYYSIV